MPREAKLVLGVAAVVGLLVAVPLYALGATTPSEAVGLLLSRNPTSEDVVLAFREEGLEVGDYFPVEEEGQSPVPGTYEEGTRFTIPSMGRDKGGRVFTFDSAEDLKPVRDYYEGFSGALFSHVYVNESKNILLQINGELSKKKAQRYNEVLQGM